MLPLGKEWNLGLKSRSDTLYLVEDLSFFVENTSMERVHWRTFWLKVFRLSAIGRSWKPLRPFLLWTRRIFSSKRLNLSPVDEGSIFWSMPLSLKHVNAKEFGWNSNRCAAESNRGLATGWNQWPNQPFPPLIAVILWFKELHNVYFTWNKTLLLSKVHNNCVSGGEINVDHQAL